MKGKKLNGDEDLTGKRSFQALKTYGGKNKEFEDWKFVLKIFLGNTAGFVEVLMEIDKLPDMPNAETMTKIIDQAQAELSESGRKVVWEWMNRQLYQILCDHSSTNLDSLMIDNQIVILLRH